MARGAALVKALGGRRSLGNRVGSVHDLADRSRAGLPYDALESLQERFGLAREEMASTLRVPLRTLARRKQAQRLSPGESDRLVRLARIAAHAAEVLGSDEKAGHWLHRPNRALGGETPLELVDTEIGAREVEAVLGRIEHGEFS
jgi:putative toxin-antitoxin system antitoxin component (TIGR02293 family)